MSIDIYISNSAPQYLRSYMMTSGYQLHRVTHPGTVATPIQDHPDIFMCSFGDEMFIGNPCDLGCRYPMDSIYNACTTNKYFIHNLKHTHPQLISSAKSRGLTLIHVAQGYTRCNLLPVNDYSFITEDVGIYLTLKNISGIDILLISPGIVQLPGYKHGFIGGAGGSIGNKIVFCGDLSSHPDFQHIKKFIENRGHEIIFFKGYPLTDIGSILSVYKTTD